MVKLATVLSSVTVPNLLGQTSDTLPHVSSSRYSTVLRTSAAHTERGGICLELSFVACGWLRNPLFFNHADLIHLIKANRERKECQAAPRLLIENKSTNPRVIFKYKLDKKEPLCTSSGGVC